jgi:hypothetical protein
MIFCGYLKKSGIKYASIKLGLYKEVNNYALVVKKSQYLALNL